MLPPTAALAFRLEAVPGAYAARIIWDDESPWTATQLLKWHVEDTGAGRRFVTNVARAWLRQALAAGPRAAQELREATARRIGRGALYTPCKAEDITIAKERTARGPWIWTLNSHSGEIEDGALPGSSEVQHL